MCQSVSIQISNKVLKEGEKYYWAFPFFFFFFFYCNSFPSFPEPQTSDAAHDQNSLKKKKNQISSSECLLHKNTLLETKWSTLYQILSILIEIQSFCFASFASFASFQLLVKQEVISIKSFNVHFEEYHNFFLLKTSKKKEKDNSLIHKSWVTGLSKMFLLFLNYSELLQTNMSWLTNMINFRTTYLVLRAAGWLPGMIAASLHLLHVALPCDLMKTAQIVF